MSAEAEKVHSMDDYRTQEGGENLAQEFEAQTSKDMGRVAIFISLLAVLLLVVAYFGLNQNIAGLNKEVKALSNLQGQVAGLSSDVNSLKGEMTGVKGSVGTLTGKVAELEKLPAQTRGMIIANDLDAMNGKLSYIGSQLDAEQAAKLQQAQQLIEELKATLVK
jgi:Na+/H+ antiporter NhaC